MSYDIIGNIALVKFNEKTGERNKKKIAKELLEKHPNIKTVLEKTERVKGRLRTIKTKHLAGERTKEAEYKENGCAFRFNIEKCYFSPRLAEERKRLMQMCRKGERILVMFGGVAPYAVVIAKNKTEIKKVVSVELGKECNRYARWNAEKNKVSSKVRLIQGDVKKVLPKLKAKGEKFDRIIMARPNLKETFLKWALMVARKGEIIHYHGFSHEDDMEKMVEEIRKECGKEKRKIKVLRVSKAGDIAPGKYRYRADIRVMN